MWNILWLPLKTVVLDYRLRMPSAAGLLRYIIVAELSGIALEKTQSLQKLMTHCTTQSSFVKGMAMPMPT